MDTEKPFVTVIDALTGETFTRELTPEEIAELPLSSSLPEDL
jgi:hypothetical protein